MVKIAFFVEGQTERIFLEKLLDSYFTHPYFNIESIQLVEDKATIITKANYDHEEVKLYFLIFDVMRDGNVNGAILERSENLINRSGYSHIIGIRDLYPNPPRLLPQMVADFNEIFREREFFNKLTQIIAVMEVEAWFIADYEHFIRMDASLRTSWLNDILDIKLETDNIESYSHPSQIIFKIWRLVGKTYKKRESDSWSICSHLDYLKYCSNDEFFKRIPSYARLINKIDELTK
jgi:hypothetical protein